MGRPARKRPDPLRFEHRGQPLAPLSVFLARLGLGALVGMGLTAGTLAAGVAGYREFEGMNTLDAFLNAAMLLGGMGPVAPLTTDNGKLFAGLYALWCGLIVIVATGFLLAPVAHRVLHALHIEDSQ